MGLLIFAYEPVLPGETLVPFLPQWAITARYAIAAKAGDEYPQLSPEKNRRQVQLMVREVLRDRFHLQFHTEPRQSKILKMVVDPDGLRLKKVTAPVPPEKGNEMGLAMSDGGGHMWGTRVSMARIAQGAGTLMRQVVVDETALKGYYDFDFSWSAPPSISGSAPSNSRLGPAGIALFTTAMKEQAGLRFVGATGPVEYWSIDHIEPPSDN